MTARPAAGTGILYHRDSDGAADCAPAEYVGWARRRAAELGVAFAGTPEQMSAMIRRRASVDGAIYLDYGVSGHELSRPGFDALFRRAETDRAVSHVFIPRRDRFARPDHPLEGLLLEFQLQKAGLTVEFMDRDPARPVVPGGQADIAGLIVAVLDYDAAGKFRGDLARKLLYAQLGLAKGGFSIGGCPPYGFERWLVHEADYHPVRTLADREHTKMAGHHVCWLPTDEAKVAVLRRIVGLLEGGMVAARVAAQLTADGVPVPDPRRNKTGVWHATTVRYLATNPLLRAVVESGKRSEGDRLRFTPTGPRPLTAADYRPKDGKPKIVANSRDGRIATAGRFEPIVDSTRHEALVAELDRRGASQRGKARARGEAVNPLGGRVWDMGCGWPMYRLARGPAYRYTCGLNQQSDCRACAYNWVDGPTTARFVLGCVRQRLLSPTAQAKLRAKLEELAAAEAGRDAAAEEAEAKRRALAAVERKLGLVSRNLGLAENEAQYAAVAAQFEALRSERDQLNAELQAAPAVTRSDPAREVDAALATFDRLPELANRAEDAAAVQDLVRQADAKLYLRFRSESRGRRVVSRPTGGVLTIGSAQPPVPVYEGPTDKAYVRAAFAKSDGAVPPELVPCCSCDTGLEVGSSGNRQRLTRRCT